MSKSIQHFLQEEEGQTLVEYGLLISLIALVVISALSILGTRTQKAFERAGANIHTTT